VTDAAERITRAMEDGERVAVYGDYDVDGVTSMAMLMRMLRLMNPDADLEAYVPHRLDEGYGLNAGALESLRERGTDLVITVDCGVTATAEIDRAREIGLDLIITDHHPLGRHPVPDVAAVVHPGLPGSDYPWPTLSGSAVAWKLLRFMADQHADGGTLPPRWTRLVKDALCLAGMGVIADVVPLVGENRVLAAKALAMMRHCRIKGVAAMLLECVKPGEGIDSTTVGFRIGPRLNAAGRIGHAKEAFDLLMTEDDEEARRLAEALTRVNRERQEIARRIEEEAVEMAAASGQAGDDERMIMLAKPEWHPGVVGIVCSRLVEKFGRPAILMGCADGPILRGSARSIKGYPINDALEACRSHFASAGGHAMAAGMSVTLDEFEEAQKAMLSHARKALRLEDLRRTLIIDAEISPQEVTPELIRSLDVMQPCGRENERALFIMRGAQVTGVKTMGARANHLELRFGQVRAPWFGQGSRCEELPRGAIVDVVGQVELNVWNGQSRPQFLIRDLVRR